MGSYYLNEDGVAVPEPLSGAAQQRRAELLHTPVRQVDLEQITSVADLMAAFSGMSIQARNLGNCAAVLERMLTDPDRPTVMLGLAGPLIAAGLRKVIRDMIEFGLVDVVVSTGAIVYQDYFQAQGHEHYRGHPQQDDSELDALNIDRIYDVYVNDEHFWDTDLQIGHFADDLPPGNYSSREFMSLLGKTVDDPHSIVGTAAAHGVPIFVPALNDSSIGIGLTEHYRRTKQAGVPGLHIDPIRDNYELASVVVRSPCTSAIYVAGGVPKNYINDAVVMSYIFGEQGEGHRYAIQVTTDVPHWGGLSGSTLREAVSWGKIHPEANTAMGFVEPSVSLPLLVATVLQRGWAAHRKRLAFTWEADELVALHPVE